MALALLLAACAAERPAPAPPPFAGQPPGPPAQLNAAPVSPVSPASPEPAALASAEPEAPEEPAAEPEPKAPQPIIAVEDPFRLDQRVVPSTKEAFLADIRDRRRWNKGGMGELVAEPPPVPGHPMPKVIVDVTRVVGPHKAAAVQREMRKMFWIKVVRCYGLGAYKNQKLRGKATLAFKVSAKGRISAPRAVSASLEDKDVVACLARETTSIDLPKARAGSRVTIDVQVGPGDEPMPPPPSEIKPGAGGLAPEALRGVIEAALPRFEACYRPAFDYAPGLWGRLGVRFHITEHGKVDEAFEFETHFPDERVTLCALRAARELSFPKPTGGDMRFVVFLRLHTDRSDIQDAQPAERSEVAAPAP